VNEKYQEKMRKKIKENQKIENNLESLSEMYLPDSNFMENTVNSHSSKSKLCDLLSNESKCILPKTNSFKYSGTMSEEVNKRVMIILCDYLKNEYTN
jgi:hypothetical protein